MNENLLLVEDEQALRTALEVRLRAEGYVVDTAGDGEEDCRRQRTCPSTDHPRCHAAVSQPDSTSVAAFGN